MTLRRFATTQTRDTSAPASDYGVPEQRPNIEFRFYGFKELASLYYPHCTPTSASRKLRRLILQDPMLIEGLELRGFRRSMRRLSPGHVIFLVDQLGSPDEFQRIVMGI